eukprot:TRINITY_DN931_c0_g1_i1.p1 TRINITY_DN931_c0_g1~~TRINITY_DN931_c0_g1_i1.p1  ORF type:complete len:597 (-),score=120.18 TRINITY_DN931_c0_g1_i1:176-1966(-)
MSNLMNSKDNEDFDNDFEAAPVTSAPVTQPPPGLSAPVKENKAALTKSTEGSMESSDSSDEDEDRASATKARWERNVPRASAPASTKTQAPDQALTNAVASAVGGASHQQQQQQPPSAAVATGLLGINSVPSSPSTMSLNAAMQAQGNSTGGIGWFNLKAPEWQALSTFAWIPKKRGETLPAALGLHLKALKALAQEEDWGDHDYVLINYLVHTFYHAQKQGKLVPFEHKEQGGQWYCFNTGLITPNFQSIYAFFMPNRQFNGLILKDYLHRYHAVKRLFPLPKRVKYFNGITDLIFDRTRRLVVDYDHIIVDNWSRLSAVLFPTEDATETQTEKNIHQTRILLKGAVKDAKRRCESNYRTAVPQMYGDKLQLLLPLCFANKNKADLALTIARRDYNPPIPDDYYYEAATMLDMRMAYNNARLIAKPERDWLIHPDTPITASEISASITSSVQSSTPSSSTCPSPAVGDRSAIGQGQPPNSYHANRRNSVPHPPTHGQGHPPGFGASSNNAGAAGATLARPPPGFTTPAFRMSPSAALRAERAALLSNAAATLPLAPSSTLATAPSTQAKPAAEKSDTPAEAPVPSTQAAASTDVV